MPDRLTRRAWVRRAANWGIAAACSQAMPSEARTAEADVALLMLCDASGSITEGDWTFQLAGHAAAFRAPAVHQTLTGTGSLVVALGRYSGPDSLEILVPWYSVRQPADALNFAKMISGLRPQAKGGPTAIGSAIISAAKVLLQAPPASRRLIDVVSNGFSNAGIDPALARDHAQSLGIGINGLVIEDEFDWLEEYFERNIMTGDGAFVITAENRESFDFSLQRKLVREIS